ncbi:MAG: bifunctional 4-hydroxy-3-methylbut-2-enyl diphosphate reductase/30S ribosomal protein S1 [Oscillospiraceae bacterium]|nr:bifunctional 4-hydroxy-3-methylbut-2-enyl diphosphate reductase/30S ribosomal protein S1 [Oscillospiraceae bacterium]
MKIIKAETAGFCFGVGRAVRLCERLLAEGRSIATLGPIIHNRQVVEHLEAKGCRAVASPGETPKGAALVIRSHGVARAVYEECERMGVEVVDATCPFVAKIHEIVSRESALGRTLLIAGDESHPEVMGIVGHCPGKAFVFDSAERLAEILGEAAEGREFAMVAQTTFNLEKYGEFKELSKKIYTNLTVFDTICNATQTRQLEAEGLARKCDVCIVIGGKNSSNTKKLYDVCSRFSKTYSIETSAELSEEMLKGAKSVGVTAGASTPSPVIEEVLSKMTEISREDEFNFEEALEDSLKLVHRGQRVEGVVTEIRPNEVVVDIGTKHTGVVPLDELSDDASAQPQDVVKLGDKINLVVTKVQDLEGIVTLSKKRVDSEKGFEEISSAVEEGTVFEVYIGEAVNKGLVANLKGVRVFIPASQATLRRGEPYEQLAHTRQKIKIIEANAGRRRAIGSIRAVLEEENKRARDEFWEKVAVGDKFTGEVKSLTSYGAFVDLGGVDGMVHISEMSWGRIKTPSEVMKVGDTVDVYVKALDPENRKVSLGFRREEDNPWSRIQEYPIGSVFTAPVVSVTKFGAFVRILPGVDGLVHISELSSEHVENPGDVVKVGDEVEVRLIGVDLERKRVSLSMRPEGEEGRPKSRLRDNLERGAAETSKAVSGALDKAAELADKAAEAASGLGEKIGEVIEKAADKASELAQSAGDYADNVRYEAKDLIEDAKPAVKAAAEAVSDTAQKAAEAVKDVYEAAAPKIADAAAKAVEAVKDMAADAAEAVKTLAEKEEASPEEAAPAADPAPEAEPEAAEESSENAEG